jgi:AmmeMemoRadiSam system protein B
MNAATRVRRPAVAGLFYPARARTLARDVDALLADATGAPLDRAPKALVLPHAGYMYSGPIAANGYARLRDDPAALTQISRVVLIGPAHRVPLRGLALPSVDALQTPLGQVPVDDALRDRLAQRPGVAVDDLPHAEEHSLEVHLPFLQQLLGSFTVVPLLAGSATDDEVAGVLDAAWGGPETLVVISTDLSHYEPHDEATRHDRRTVDAILAGDPTAIGPGDACGRIPLRGLLVAAGRRGLRPVLLDQRTSGDTAGTRERVVGYAAIAFIEAA